jgi:hypothetical protein
MGSAIAKQEAVGQLASQPRSRDKAITSLEVGTALGFYLINQSSSVPIVCADVMSRVLLRYDKQKQIG